MESPPRAPQKKCLNIAPKKSQLVLLFFGKSLMEDKGKGDPKELVFFGGAFVAIVDATWQVT